MARPTLRFQTVFLDRDGVINRDSADYIQTPDHFQFIPGSLEALVRLHRAGCRIIVVTNQSGVGRGLIRPRDLRAIHEKMQHAVHAAGGWIHDILYCPHLPEDRCGCRKPRPGMVHTAAARHGVDLGRAVMVGDSVRDIECGQRAGCRDTILVRTGNGRRSEAALQGTSAAPSRVVDDLQAAASWLRDTACRAPGKDPS